MEASFLFCVPGSLNGVFPYKIFINLAVMHGQLGLWYMTGKKSLSQCEERSTQNVAVLKEGFALVLSCPEAGVCFVVQHTPAYKGFLCQLSL